GGGGGVAVGRGGGRGGGRSGGGGGGGGGGERGGRDTRHDFESTLRTFARPRYELIATGEVYDGEEAVRGYYAATRAAFPDQRNVVQAIHHADDAVVVEFDLLGTHRGPLRG